MRRLSSTFKRKSTSTQQSGDASKATPPATIHEEIESPALFTPKSRKEVLKEEQLKAAAESLRKDLKAKLRPDLSTDGLHQIQLNGVLDVHREVLGSKEDEPSQIKKLHMPSHGIRRVSTKWDNINPFNRPLPSVGSNMPSQGIRRVSTTWDSTNPFVEPAWVSGTKTWNGIEKFTHEAFRPSHDGSVEEDDQHRMDTERFRGSVSASWLQADSYSHPAHFQQSVHEFRKSMSASAPLIRAGTQVGDVPGGRLQGSSGSGSEMSTLVVVARAECELAHPIPSRSTEARLMKVLVTEKAEKNQVVERRGNQISHESESMASVGSYHTARQETSGD